VEEFIRSYGIWILLALVFAAMHWFGMGCGGGHRHGSNDETDGTGDERKKRGARSGGCH
jgi:hypothetical protein